MQELKVPIETYLDTNEIPKEKWTDGTVYFLLETDGLHVTIVVRRSDEAYFWARTAMVGFDGLESRPIEAIESYIESKFINLGGKLFQLLTRPSEEKYPPWSFSNKTACEQACPKTMAVIKKLLPDLATHIGARLEIAGD